MNDDELGRFLRSEVPDPGAGYWDEIDRRLQQAEAEAGVEGELQPEPGSAPPSFPTSAPIGDTDDNVIRLTDMNQAILPQQQSKAPFLLAAAAVLLVVGGFVALQTSGVFRSDDTLTTADEAPNDGATGSDGSTDGATGSDGGTDGDEAVADTPTPGAAERVCYSGSFLPADGSGEVDIHAWIERDGADARLGLLLVAAGIESIEVGEGMIDADGRFDGVTRSTLGSSNVVDTLIVTDEALTDTVEPIRIPAVPCGDVADEMGAIDDTADQLAAQDAGEAGAEGVTVDEEPARVWTVIGDEPLEILASPGETDEVLTTAPAGTLLGGAGGAAVSLPDNVRWVAIYLRQPGLPASFGWIPADRIAATEWTNRLCFSSTDPSSVLVLDVDRPAGTPLGAIVTTGMEDPLGNEPEVTLVAEATAANAEELGDGLEVFVQAGDEWEPQSWAQTSFGVSGPDLAWEPVDCGEVGQALAFIEAFRNDIPLPE